jgi:origin recognition complex subunit 4
VVFHEDVDVEDKDEKQIEEHFGFKDIDSSRKKNGNRSTRRVSESPENRHEDVFEDAAEYQDQPRQQGAIGQEDDDSIADGYSDIDDVPPTFQPESKKALSATNDENPHLTSIKLQVLSRLMNHDENSKNPATAIPVQLRNQYATLHSLLTATVTAGESNSLLLLGSRGSGKSFLVESALADLDKSHSDYFHVVRLNGFFQTDDKLALREIWHQLGREMAVPEDETGEVSSYADTMASLLSLLSHPEELGVPNAPEIDGAISSFQERPAWTSKSVIFIMDEFDLFTTHPRQTLLYNLFDIAQARKAPIAVIGCSTRMDVVECLEKRVKSRFSHRWLHIPAGKSLAGFEETVKQVLCLPVEGPEALGVGKDELEWRARWKEFIEVNLLRPSVVDELRTDLLLVQTQFLPSPAVQSMLKRTFSSTKSIPDVLTALYIPIATLSVPAAMTDHSTAPFPGIMATTTALPSLLALLPHLPILHLSLLISATRLETIYDVMIVNFTLVHKQYTELLTRSKLQRSSLLSFTKGGSLTGAGLRTWNKDTARSAWEELAQWEFIVPTSSVGGRLGDEGLGGDGIVTRMFRVDVTLDEVAWAVKQKLGAAGVGETLHKWCREV